MLYFPDLKSVWRKFCNILVSLYEIWVSDEGGWKC